MTFKYQIWKGAAAAFNVQLQIYQKSLQSFSAQCQRSLLFLTEWLQCCINDVVSGGE